MLAMAMAALVASSPGQTFGVSIFNESIRSSLELTHSQLAAAYMVGTILGALPITYIGSLMDRCGLRRTMLSVVTLFSCACFLLASVCGWWTLAVAFCMLRMLGPGSLAFLSGNTLAFWFERRLGFVEGVRTLALSAAMGTVPALNLWLMERYGWRGSYLVLGAGIWVGLFPIAFLFFRNRPEDVGQRIDNIRGDGFSAGVEHASLGGTRDFTLREAVRTPAFCVVTVGGGLFGMILTAVVFSVVPIMQEHGFDAEHAAAMITAFAITSAIAQFAGGALADQTPTSWLAAAGLFGFSLSIAMLVWATSPVLVLLAGAMMGAAQGLYSGATQPMWARYFGRRHLGKIRGVLMTVMVASSSAGPLAAGLSRDLLGSFHPALWAFAALPIPLACASFLVRPPVEVVDSAATTLV